MPVKKDKTKKRKTVSDEDKPKAKKRKVSTKKTETGPQTRGKKKLTIKDHFKKTSTKTTGSKFKKSAKAKKKSSSARATKKKVTEKKEKKEKKEKVKKPRGKKIPPNEVRYERDELILAFHGPCMYKAKVLKVTLDIKGRYGYLLHYQGWKKKWDEWVAPDRMRKVTPANLSTMKSMNAAAKKNKGKVQASDSSEMSTAKKITLRQNVESVEDIKARREIPLVIPLRLKERLADDFFCVGEEQLLPLPRSPTINQIISRFLDYQRAELARRATSRKRGTGKGKGKGTSKKGKRKKGKGKLDQKNEKVKDNVPETKEEMNTAVNEEIMEDVKEGTNEHVTKEAKQDTTTAVMEGTQEYTTTAAMDTQEGTNEQDMKKCTTEDTKEDTKEKRGTNTVMKEEPKEESKEEIEMGIFEEVFIGVRKYFDCSLGTVLLYNIEQLQLREIQDSTPSLCDIYGAEHLLRLFVKLPSMLANTTMTTKQRTLFLTRVAEFIRWLERQSDIFVKDYTPTDLDYKKRLCDLAAEFW